MLVEKASFGTSSAQPARCLPVHAALRNNSRSQSGAMLHTGMRTGSAAS